MSMFNSQLSIAQVFHTRMIAYAQLSKIRLTLLVVFSSIMAFLFEGTATSLINILILFAGGLMVTASSISINQILEKDSDGLMNRTKNRPLPTGTISVIEATVFAGINGVGGIILLALYFNTITGLLAAISLLIYAFIYTPFKKISPAAVFIGALPGAIPLLIGATAATGSITSAGVILFTIQLVWQMPHFWAIAWVADEDYKRGGYTLLPSGKGKSRNAALQILPYNILLIMVGTVPFFMRMTGYISLVIGLIAGILFLYAALKLCIDLKDKSAKLLMFMSFFYIPIVQIALVLDRI